MGVRRWPGIALTGLTVAGAAYLFVRLSVYGYVSLFSALGIEGPNAEQLGGVAAFAGTWGVSAFLFGCVVHAARRSTERAGDMPFFHGFGVGAASALASWTVFNYQYRPVEWWELGWFSVLGILGGALGGALGRRALERQEAVVRASAAVSVAPDRNAVAAAVGRHVGGGEATGVSLWRALRRPGLTDPSPTGFEAEGAWSSRDESLSDRPTRARLASEAVPGLGPLLEAAVKRAATGNPPTAFLDRSRWPSGTAPRDASGVLVLPLMSAGGTVAGLMTVALRRRRALRRPLEREYLTVAAHVATRLENLGLVEAERRAAVHKDRRRIGREMHDTVAQGLVSVVAFLEGADPATGSGEEAANAPERTRLLRRAKATAREHLSEVRRAVWALRSPGLDQGLCAALERLGRDLAEEAGLSVEVETPPDGPGLSSRAEDAVYAAAREALTNVRKHAEGATRTKVTLSLANGWAILDVRDDGASQAQSEDSKRSAIYRPEGVEGPGGGYGLRAMSEHLEELGGTLLVESEPGAGTAFTAKVPYGVTPAGVPAGVPGSLSTGEA